MAKDQPKETNWTEVAAKAQAYQAMHLAGLSDNDKDEKKWGQTEKAKFLMVLGLTRSEAAGLLRSSDDSLRHLLATDAKTKKSSPAKAEGAPDGS